MAEQHGNALFYCPWLQLHIFTVIMRVFTALQKVCGLVFVGNVLSKLRKVV